jgi:hypothetical protein
VDCKGKNRGATDRQDDRSCVAKGQRVGSLVDPAQLAPSQSVHDC